VNAFQLNTLRWSRAEQKLTFLQLLVLLFLLHSAIGLAFKPFGQVNSLLSRGSSGLLLPHSVFWCICPSCVCHFHLSSYIVTPLEHLGRYLCLQQRQIQKHATKQTGFYLYEEHEQGDHTSPLIMLLTKCSSASPSD
jgi:hypothetical protein